MPQPDEQTVPARRSRHAADESADGGQADIQLDGTWNTAEYEAVLREEAARHRRPETLADSTRLRPVSVPPSTRRSVEEEVFELGEFKDSFIEQGFPEMTRAEERAEQRRSDAIRLAEERRNENAKQDAASRTAGLLSRFLPRKSETRKAEPRATRSRGGKSRSSDTAAKDKPDPAPATGTTPAIPRQRARHAAPPAPLISVSALPAMRDAVSEGLPAAVRAAGGIRDWALYTGDQPPATGSHRASGTLPIESWLLVGKTRQQAILATMVAVGLLLVFIPMHQRGAAVDPVNAAEQAVAKIDGRSVGKRTVITPAEAGKPAVAATPAGTPAASAPTSAKSTPAVPKGGGPANSMLSTGTQAVALTFDDGPDPVETPKILALLAEYHVKATFCLVGQNVEKHPEIVREIVAGGHTLCDHTWNHSLTIGQDKPAEIQADLQRTNDAIHAAVPGVPIPFFRAPGGNFTDKLVKVAAGDGMTSLYWRVDPRDWDHPAGESDAAHITKVIDGVRTAVKPGSIVLSHDFNQPDTIKAYEQLLPWLVGTFQLGLPPEKVTPPSSAPVPSAEPSSDSSAPVQPPSAEPSVSPSEPVPVPVPSAPGSASASGS